METRCSQFSWNTASKTAIGARKRSKIIKFSKPGRNTTNELSKIHRTVFDICQVDEKSHGQAVRGELASIEIQISEVRERWKLRLVGRVPCILTHVEML